MPALLASATLPLINPPKYIQGVPYVDGGLILNMPSQLPAYLVNKHPYIGLNVAYGKTLRKNRVNTARKASVWGLSLVYGAAQKDRHAWLTEHEAYRPIHVHQIVADNEKIKRVDFGKVRQAIYAGYELAYEQLQADPLGTAA